MIWFHFQNSISGKLFWGKVSILGLWWMVDYYKAECTLRTYPINVCATECCTKVASCGSWNCSVQKNMLIKAVSIQYTNAHKL